MEQRQWKRRHCSYCSQEEETGSGKGKKTLLSEGWRLKRTEKRKEKNKMGLH